MRANQMEMIEVLSGCPVLVLVICIVLILVALPWLVLRGDLS